METTDFFTMTPRPQHSKSASLDSSSESLNFQLMMLEDQVSPLQSPILSPAPAPSPKLSHSTSAFSLVDREPSVTRTSSQGGKANISVCVRVRPYFGREASAGWELTEDQISLDRKNWKFDRVFTPHHMTEDVYASKIQPIVWNFLDGYNGTIMAYGQSGSGKTHTLLGDESRLGLLQLALQDIFHRIAHSKEYDYTLRVDPIEVYMKEARHLLEPVVPVTVAKKRVCSPPTREFPLVKSLKDIRAVLDSALAVRMQGISNYNEHSSRSHFIFRVILAARPHDANGSRLSGFESELLFVDLAGSERMLDKHIADRHGLSESELDQHRAQGNAINSSLLFLHIVIDQLTKNSPFVAYKDHILTRILENSLGGNSKTCIVCTVSGAHEHRDFTTKTLSFGSSARLIKTTVKKNTGVNLSPEEQKLISQMQADLAKWRRRCKELEAQNQWLMHHPPGSSSKHDKWETSTDISAGVDDNNEDEDEEDGVHELSTARRAGHESGASTPSSRSGVREKYVDHFDLDDPNSSPLRSPIQSPPFSPAFSPKHSRSSSVVHRARTPSASPSHSRTRTNSSSLTSPLILPSRGSNSSPSPHLSRRSSFNSLTRSDSRSALAEERETRLRQQIKELTEKLKDEHNSVLQAKKNVDEHIKSHKKLEHEVEKKVKEIEHLKQQIKATQDQARAEKEKLHIEIKALQASLKAQLKLTQAAEKQAHHDRQHAHQLEEQQRRAMAEVEALRKKVKEAQEEAARHDAAHARAAEEKMPFMRPRRLFETLGLILHRKTFKQDLEDVERLRAFH